MEPHSVDMRVGGGVVTPESVVRELGVFFVAELSIREHVSMTSLTCFCHLCRIRFYRRQLGREVTARLVSALALSNLDYCNAVLAGLPASKLYLLQKALHAESRLA